jgi:formate dehydrogenase accessory protein FdhE
LEIDHPILLDHFGSLLSLAKRRGSETLAAQADELAAEKSRWKALVTLFWNGDLAAEDSFFARACLQPYLELLANTQTQPFDSNLAASDDRQVRDAKLQLHRLCPFCGRKPQLALLSDETDMPGVAGSAEGGRRFLMCGDCLTLWPYQRIACANCPEGAPHKLPYYAAEDMPHIRVECCESCKRYIKSIDLTKDQRPVPPVDELAAIPLDLWAREKGYIKIQPNLAAV